ncbi:MAG: hypothetical protein KDA68_03955 [Planctomycetaceae bacterium]|nr:hypothetical protein [Planctomycetaceae bacterium]
MDEDPAFIIVEDLESGRGVNGESAEGNPEGEERFSREPYFMTRRIPGWIRRIAAVQIVVGGLLLLSPIPEIGMMAIVLGAICYLKGVICQWQIDWVIRIQKAKNRDRNEKLQ